MKLRWGAHFFLLTSSFALPSAEPDAEPDAEPQLYGSGYSPESLSPMMNSGGLGGQGFNPGGLLPGEGGQGYYPGGTAGATVVQPSPGGVWGGGIPQGDQCGMMDQCCGELGHFMVIGSLWMQAWLSKAAVRSRDRSATLSMSGNAGEEEIQTLPVHISGTPTSRSAKQ